jgi:hypothetical protein
VQLIGQPLSISRISLGNSRQLFGKSDLWTVRSITEESADCPMDAELASTAWKIGQHALVFTVNAFGKRTTSSTVGG